MLNFDFKEITKTDLRHIMISYAKFKMQLSRMCHLSSAHAVKKIRQKYLTPSFN